MFVSIIPLIILSTIAVSWGWGMRGTAIGGEKGAMLPGALCGFFVCVIISKMSGFNEIINYAFEFAGVGAISMYCGGVMTYGETLNMTMRNDEKREALKGYSAVFIKGALWFSICFGAIFMYLGILTGYYKLWQIILFFAFMPVLTAAGHRIFNLPFNPEICQYPKFYFSYTRQETWGVLTGIVADILLFSLNSRDYLTFTMTLCGALTGGIGWIIGELFQDKCINPSKNNRYFFGLIKDNSKIEKWKLMECTLGAFGGLGISVFTVLLVPKYLPLFTTSPVSFTDDKTSKIFAIIYFIVLIIDSVQYFITPERTKKDLAEMLKLTLISKEEYERTVISAPENESGKLTSYRNLCEKCEFLIYSYLPMIFIFIGSRKTAVMVSTGVLLLVLSQEISFKLFKHFRSKRLWEIIFYLLSAILCVIAIFTDISIGFTLLMLIYTFVYEFIVICRLYKDYTIKLKTDKNAKIFGHATPVHIYFLICCTVLMIASLFL